MFLFIFGRWGSFQFKNTQEKLNKPQQKCGGVRREYGRVNDEEQNDPVPHSFEWAVVKDGPLLDPGSLQLVLW